MSSQKILFPKSNMDFASEIQKSSLLLLNSPNQLNDELIEFSINLLREKLSIEPMD